MSQLNTTRKATPEITVRLDVPPARRWTSVGEHWRTRIQGLTEEIADHYPCLLPALGAAASLAALAGNSVAQELASLARGSNVSVGALAAGNLMYDVSTIPGQFGCTAIACQSAAEGPVLVRTVDWAFPPGIERQTVFLRFDGCENPVDTVTFPGLIGLLSAVNTRYAATLNQLVIPGCRVNPRYPALVRFRDGVTSSRSLPELVARIQKSSPGASFGVCGVSQDIAGIAYVGQSITIREEAVLTNHRDAEYGTEDSRRRLAYAGQHTTVDSAIRAARSWPINKPTTVQAMALVVRSGEIRML